MGSLMRWLRRRGGVGNTRAARSAPRIYGKEPAEPQKPKPRPRKYSYDAGHQLNHIQQQLVERASTHAQSTRSAASFPDILT